MIQLIISEYFSLIRKWLIEQISSEDRPIIKDASVKICSSAFVSHGWISRSA